MNYDNGGVSERLKEHAWKVCIRETVSRVRISPPPSSLLILLLLLILSPFSSADLSTYNVVPLKLETGARYLGLGSAASSIAYDANSMFYNPGAMPWSKGIAATVMDANNISAAEAFPTGYGTTIGFGALLSSKKLSSGTLNSNTLALSVGTRLDSLIYFPQNENFSKNTGLGFNLKTLLNQSLLIPGQADQTGSGWNLDFGILHRYSSWIDLGLVGYNLLPENKIEWSNATAESIPSYFKAGISAKVVGDLRSPIFWEDNKIMVSADLEMRKQALLHLGIEWTNAGIYLARVGLSQNIRQDQVQNDLSFGVGLRNPDWQLDAAVGKEPVNGENAVYISTVYFPTAWLFLAHPIENISLLEQMETYDSSIEVTGKIRKEVELSINSTAVSADAYGKFTYSLPLEPGLNIATVETNYAGETQTKTYNIIRKIPPATPADVVFLSGSTKTYYDTFEITGKLSEGIKSLTINGQPVNVDESGNFRYSLPLKMGENVLYLEGKVDGITVSKRYVITRISPQAIKPPVTKIEKKPLRTAKRPVKKIAPVIVEKPTPEVKPVQIVKKRPIGYVAKLLFSRFGKKQAEIWESLIAAGYIDKKGNILPAFYEDKKNFNLFGLFSPAEIGQVFNILNQPQRDRNAETRRIKKEQKIILAASREAEALRKRIKLDQEKFEKLQILIRDAAGLKITKQVKIKMPAGYLSVYAVDDGRYLALKYLGNNKVAVEVYISSTGKWSILTYLPYTSIKDLI